MKDFLKVIVIHIIGFIHLWTFFNGYLNNNESDFIMGGTGLFIFIYLMIIDQPRNMNGFLFSLVIGSIVAIFISKWYKGFFWVSALYSIGQIPGFIYIISKAREAIYLSKVENPNQRLSPLDLIPMVSQIILPYIVTRFFT